MMEAIAAPKLSKSNIADLRSAELHVSGRFIIPKQPLSSKLRKQDLSERFDILRDALTPRGEEARQYLIGE